MLRKQSRTFPLALFVVWFLLVVSVDGFVLYGQARSLWATTWPEAPGTITHSSVSSSRGKNSISYKLEVRYSYSVNGTLHEGTRYRFNNPSISDSEAAEALARRYSVGSSVTVFHAPDATDAVLEPGLSGGDLFLLLFLMPFNMVLVGVAQDVFMRRKGDPVVNPVQKEGRLHVALNTFSPTLAWVIGAGGASFAANFFVGIPTDFQPSLPVVLITWGAVVAVGMYARGWMRRRVSSGHYDLVLDFRARRLSLPAISGRKARLEVAWDDVQAVVVDTHEQKTSKGVRKTHRPTLELTGEQGTRRESLVELTDLEVAEAVADWVRAQVKPGRSGRGVARSA